MCFIFSETQQGIFDAIIKGVIDFSTDPWPRISDSAKDLIKRMLSSHPADRPTAHEVLCKLAHGLLRRMRMNIYSLNHIQPAIAPMFRRISYLCECIIHL